MHISGSPVIRLDNEELDPAEIQVAGDWVYFNNSLMNDHDLYRVPVDGGEVENLFEGKDFLPSYGSYCIIGDWIVIKQNGVVYRMLTDGSYVEMITDSLPISIDENDMMMFSRGYVSSSERIGDSKESIGEVHLTLYKLDNEGQLYTITSLKADYYINLLSFHENGLIYELATKDGFKIQWISLELD